MASRNAVRAVMLGGSAVRLSYAMGLLLAPELMSRMRLGATTAGNGMASMTTRAFGAMHANVALATAAAAVLNRHLDLALRANLAGDFGDAVGPLLEWRFGSLDTRLALANTVVQSSGMATWAWALRACKRDG